MTDERRKQVADVILRLEETKATLEGLRDDEQAETDWPQRAAEDMTVAWCQLEGAQEALAKWGSK